MVREPTDAELDAVYLMGIDAWSDDLTREQYLETCRTSPKYRRGRWWILEHEGGPVSSLLVYQGHFGLPEGCAGIGSVATPKDLRGQGFASRLITRVVDRLAARGHRAVFLFSDVDPAFYLRLGFSRLHEPADSRCLVRVLAGPSPPVGGEPTYF